MKLNRSFVQISLTALITSAVFVVPMAYSGTGLFYTGPAPSSRVPTWADATRMQDEYLDLHPLRVQIPEDDNHGERMDLKGFTFSVAHLEEIIHNNKSNQPPDEVYFQFGQEGKFGDDFLGGLFHDSGHMRLVAVGMKNKTLLIDADNTGQISVFDKADPCPPMCPK